MGQGIYHKQRLVPFGEFVPLEDWLRGTIPFFDLAMSSFLEGEDNQPLIQMEANGQLNLIAAYICYEIAYPRLVAHMAQDADLLVTVSNDAWFGDSLGPKQHMGLAQMRALENGKYLLRATNTGITALVDNKGHIVKQMATASRGHLMAKAEARTGQTPYNRNGLIPLALLSIWSLTLAAGLMIKSSTSQSNNRSSNRGSN